MIDVASGHFIPAILCRNLHNTNTSTKKFQSCLMAVHGFKKNLNKPVMTRTLHLPKPYDVRNQPRSSETAR
jgi:hypothetical protein